jgi:hypothetical protein
LAAVLERLRHIGFVALMTALQKHFATPLAQTSQVVIRKIAMLTAVKLITSVILQVLHTQQVESVREGGYAQGFCSIATELSGNAIGHLLWDKRLTFFFGTA